MSGPIPSQGPDGAAPPEPSPGLRQLPIALRVALFLLFASLAGLLLFELLGNVVLYIVRYLSGQRGAL